MAKKSNKTEHVLKLITKNEDAQDDFFSIEKETTNGSSAILSVKPQTASAPQSVKGKTEPGTAIDNDLKYEAKLKIEIQPEIEVKQSRPIEAKQSEPAEEEQDESADEKPIEPVEEKKIEPTEVKLNEPDVKPDEPAEKKKNAPEMGKVLMYENHSQNKEGSAYFEKHDYLVNIAEILAKERIALVMERMKVCTCPTCVNDVLALALNSLPTKYVTTESGKQYYQLDAYKKQYETDVLAALTKACVRVKASPRHEK